jgi:hypothetical protein
MICAMYHVYSQSFEPFHSRFIILTMNVCPDDEVPVEGFEMLTINLAQIADHPKIWPNDCHCEND